MRSLESCRNVDVLSTPSAIPGLKRALALWPYLLVTISLTGFAYFALR